jgi:putative PIN family toxin of toxin-antitoxin system
VIRVTLDVNVLVSGMPASRGVPAELISRWLRREFVLVISDHILTEAAEAWEQPYWARRYHLDQAAEAIALLRERAWLVTPADNVHGVGEDEEDDLVIATAIGGGAQFLVTGDKALQALLRIEDMAIVSPRQFLDLLDRERASGN